MWALPWLLITLVGGTILGVGMYLYDEWREKATKKSCKSIDIIE